MNEFSNEILRKKNWNYEKFRALGLEFIEQTIQITDNFIATKNEAGYGDTHPPPCFLSFPFAP
ncbi:MAG: hypothetical protein LBL30_02870 [Holosporales bacterium]|jgi:hypothetical protein|nr:hypothetical protein [Holosporales bacterium]